MTTSEPRQAPAAPGRLFRSKPAIIAAVQWTGDNIRECAAFAPGRVRCCPPSGAAEWLMEVFVGDNGNSLAQVWMPVAVPTGHWVVREQGDYRVVAPVVFAATYEPVAE